MSDVTVPLSRTYLVHDKTFDRVTLREPTFQDIYIDGLGEPTEWQRSQAGVMVRLVRHDVIGEYVSRLATEPTVDYLVKLNPVDSIRLAEAVRDFFIVPDTPENAPTG